MRNTIKIVVLFLMLLTVSCTLNNQSNDYLELNNKVLEREIEGYAKYADSIFKESHIINVYCLEVNDSTSRYVVDCVTNPEIIKKWPYHFVCKIGERDVFFTMLAGIVKKDSGNKNFFNMDEKAYGGFIKRYFPGDYKYYKEGMQKAPCNINDIEMYYLTFVNHKLVKKELKRGLALW
nr:hypothetical protein [uncultured Bacteroides sp.]